MQSRQTMVLGVMAGVLGLALPLQADEKPHPESPSVERHKDIAYRTDAAADAERHKLDLYCPKGKKNFPVILFVHGGSWKSGNKSLYAGIGESLAQDGIGVVICNYRLSPKVQHPAHVEDVARAFAWTRDNIAKYGGNPDNIFLYGHSAGGHLVSLLATDPSYLKAEHCSVADIRGVVSVSGVYVIYTTELLFRPVFGSDKDMCKKASPLTHVRGDHPPFLLAYAEKDYPYLDRMAEDMSDALKKVNSPCEVMKCADRNHISIIVNAVESDDPLNKAVRSFIKARSK